MPGGTEMENTENTAVQLQGTKALELPKFDPTPLVGKKVVIESVTEHKGTYGYYVKVSTVPVQKLGDRDVRASRIFGLVEVDAQVGWGTESKLADFLKSKHVDHYSKLKGKEVVLQVDIKGDDKYLSFI